ncbi:uncharacterized protein BYT42DRAFT_581608, partial [Radiomyces spectabilis]|uniref:uncharacterized protein n=1 Tax=Radiomyces spectabilis TaxID=64574 RepID=UPI00221F8DF9
KKILILIPPKKARFFFMCLSITLQRSSSFFPELLTRSCGNFTLRGNYKLVAYLCVSEC